MKFLFIFTTLLTTFLFFGQETNDGIFYYDSIGNSTQKENYHYYKIIKDFKLKQNKYKYTYFNKKNNITSEGYTSNKMYNTNVDEYKSYYNNGNLKEVIVYDSLSRMNGMFIEYYENGKKAIEGENKIIDNKSNHTILSFWDQNGKQTVTNGNGIYSRTKKEEKYFFSEKGRYKNGLKDGDWEGKESYSNDVNCLLTFNEKYQDGRLVEGCSYDDDYNPHIYTEQFINPEPKEGLSSFLKFVQRNYHTDEIAENITKDISGRIIVEFVVEKDGTINDIRVIKDLGFGTGKEAVRMLKSAPKFVPGQSRGKTVRVRYMLPIYINIKTSE